MEPDARDLDDTVERAPRLHTPPVRPIEDVERTITVERTRRPLHALVDPPSPAQPAAAAASAAPAAAAASAAPAAASPATSPVELPPVPDLRDNVWSQPVPERPGPFRLLLSDGTLVPLDQPVYLGRKPSVPRIHPGGIPLLVTFDSPQHEVSSTHLKLSTVGGTIVASDTKSTNGSVLRVPGAAPRTLIGGASAVVTPGTMIELGDGNLIELLAPDPDAASPDSSGARS